MNHFLKGFGKGFSDYGPAISFLFNHKLAWALLVPVFLNILLFVGGFAAIGSLSDYLQAQLLSAVSLDGANFFGAEMLSWLLAGTVWLISKILFFFIFAYTGGYIIIILMSPLLAYLSERTEQILTGNEYPFDIQQLMRDVVRGVLIALRNMIYQLLFILALFILAIFPLVGWLVSLLTPFILFFLASYFYGFSFTDYVNERQRMSVKESVRFMQKNKGVITGNGMPFALILLIPFFGLTFSGFFAIIAVIASVISVKDHLQKPKTKEQVNIQVDELQKSKSEQLLEHE